MLKLNKNVLTLNSTKPTPKTLFPKDTTQLMNYIFDCIEEVGPRCSLNHIDTSKIKDMSYLFCHFNKFNGDISEWDVSNVKSMEHMFEGCDFDGDISSWNVSNVENMQGMFFQSKYSGQNGGIKYWNVENCKNFKYMFKSSKFNNDLSLWNVKTFLNKKKIWNTEYMFRYCNIDFKYLPNYVLC